MKLTFSRRAQLDLVEIAEWIGRDNPVRAVTFVDELEAVCERLTDFPLAFAEVEGTPGVRKRGYRKYIILFEADDATVTITSIRHGARGSPR